MSDAAVADSTNLDKPENTVTQETAAQREITSQSERTETFSVGFNEVPTNNTVQEESVRGHSFGLEMENEPDYEIAEGDSFMEDVHPFEHSGAEKTQPPQRISWNEWAGSGDGQDNKSKPLSDDKEEVIDVQRVPVTEQRKRRDDYNRESPRKSSNRRLQHQHHHHYQEYGHRRQHNRDRSPVTRRPIHGTSRRSGMEQGIRSGPGPGPGSGTGTSTGTGTGTGTGTEGGRGRCGVGGNSEMRIPPGMHSTNSNTNLSTGNSNNGNDSSAVNLQTSDGGIGAVRPVVSRGMPPGLGVSRNTGPKNFMSSLDGKGRSSWRGGGPRAQHHRSPPPPPPPPSFGDRGRRGHPPSRFNSGRIPDSHIRGRYDPDMSMNRRYRSPNRASSGPLNYSERSFLSQNNRRGRFNFDNEPSENYHRRTDRPEGFQSVRNRNSLSPRSMSRVPPSPRRVTLPVQRSGPTDGHYARGKTDNIQRSPVERRPPSPVFYRQPVVPRRDLGSQHHFRRMPPRDHGSPPPRQRRPPPRGDYNEMDRRQRQGDFRQGRNNYNHQRTPSPSRVNKRPRQNSPDRRPHRETPRMHDRESAPPPPNPPMNPIQGGDVHLEAALHYTEMECAWYYVDPRGNTQGPCAIQQFRSWLKTLAEDPEFVDEHKQFRSVSVWKEGMHERYLMTELLERNVP